jgi:hypothetical protein
MPERFGSARRAFQRLNVHNCHQLAYVSQYIYASSHVNLAQRHKSSPSYKSSNTNLLNSKEENQDTDTYAVAILHEKKTAMPSSPRSLKLITKNLTIGQILEQAPGTHARDFFSLSLTSLGDAASRKKRASYSVNKIHPWFVLPRDDEIIVSFSCLQFVRST